MLMEVRNQLKVTLLTVKYGLMREMLNKSTFIMNVIFMILNNASFIIQWVILYSLKANIGGYSFNQVLLLWGIASGTYGIAHFFFKKAFSLSDTINNGKLDSFLVQPKNVLLSAITTDVDSSAVGDIIYGYITLFIYGFSFKLFGLFTLFMICGGLIIASFAVILASLSFWFNKSDMIADTANSLITHFATYPDGIFKGLAKVMLYVLIPVGIANYIPVKVMSEFNIWLMLLVILVTVVLIFLAFLIFNKGLKRYSSSNLMSARI